MYSRPLFSQSLILWPLGVGVATVVSIVPKLATVWIYDIGFPLLSSLLRAFLTLLSLLRVFCAAFSSGVQPLRILSLVLAQSLMCSLISLVPLYFRSFPIWAEFLYIYTYLRPSTMNLVIDALCVRRHFGHALFCSFHSGPDTTSKWPFSCNCLVEGYAWLSPSDLLTLLIYCFPFSFSCSFRI